MIFTNAATRFSPLILNVSALCLDTCPGFFYRVCNMPRLIVNPGTENAWEIPLQPGFVSLGRGPENTFSIEHPSVSSAHCRLTVTDSGVVIKDLGSVNGTFVNNAMVDEAPLSNGQTFRLGDVVLQFESDQIPLARPMRDVVVRPQSATGAFCKFHPHAAAQFLCPKCRNTFCALCVSHRQGRYFCRACGEECGPLAQQTRTPEAREKSFYAQILEAFRYPFKGNGFILLIGGAIFFSGAQIWGAPGGDARPIRVRARGDIGDFWSRLRVQLRQIHHHLHRQWRRDTAGLAGLH